MLKTMDENKSDSEEDALESATAEMEKVGCATPAVHESGSWCYVVSVSLLATARES